MSTVGELTLLITISFELTFMMYGLSIDYFYGFIIIQCYTIKTLNLNLRAHLQVRHPLASIT